MLDVKDVDDVAEYADMLQIGTRNMQNFGLLQAVGRVGKPVMLKRGLSATYEEWLMAAEYVAQRGNLDIVLCERGIRSFEPAIRNMFDVSAVPMVQPLSHLPVIVDPSHAAGRADLVVPLARAGIAAGADGVMVDVHPHPEQALVDGAQALTGAPGRAGRGRRHAASRCSAGPPPPTGPAELPHRHLACAGVRFVLAYASRDLLLSARRSRPDRRLWVRQPAAALDRRAPLCADRTPLERVPTAFRSARVDRQFGAPNLRASRRWRVQCRMDLPC